MRKQTTTENCFCRPGDRAYSETYRWADITEEGNHLKCIAPKAHKMLLNLLKMMMNVNGQNNCTYEPFNIKISRSAFVSGTFTQTCTDFTLGGDLYVNGTGRTVEGKLPFRSSTIMVELGLIIS